MFKIKKIICIAIVFIFVSCSLMSCAKKRHPPLKRAGKCGPGMVWVAGHHNPGGKWIPGHCARR